MPGVAVRGVHLCGLFNLQGDDVHRVLVSGSELLPSESGDLSQGAARNRRVVDGVVSLEEVDRRSSLLTLACTPSRFEKLSWVPVGLFWTLMSRAESVGGGGGGGGDSLGSG